MSNIVHITLLVLVALIATTIVTANLDPSIISEELKATAENLQKNCIQETQVDKDLVLKALNDTLTNDEKFKCYVRCLLKNTKCLQPDGSVNYTAIKKILPSSYYDALDRMIKKCGGPAKNPNSCERSYEFITCFLATEPAHFIMF